MEVEHEIHNNKALQLAERHFLTGSRGHDNMGGLPLGITPGSMKVASVKLAITKNVMTPWYAGTHGKRSR